jgi:cytochrome c553
MAELELASKAGLLKGGSRGAAIVPGSAEGSLLLKAISYKDLQLKMPPTGKLSEQQIADFRSWIQMGAPDPRAEQRAPPPAPETIDIEEGRKFWSFQPIRHHEPPAVRDESWPVSPIDRFILDALEEKGLSPAPPADKAALLRRVTFDLIGLPPTPEEITAFVNDDSPQAFGTVVERLLGSPHYGERWGRHWLDLVRYAETNGHEFDNDKLDAWRYRDYVIRAFNNDVPYDRFVQEHIAGDLLPEPRLTSDGSTDESSIGTGVYWFGEVLNSATDSAKSRADQVDNQIDVLGKAFLGLTVACARCHDHKFDPIPTADYYSLAGVLHSTEIRETVIDSPARAREIRSLRKEIRATNDRMQSLLLPVWEAMAAKLDGYLLAAAAVLTEEDDPAGGEAASDSSLDRQLIRAWVAALETARTDPDHVFYPFVRVLDSLREGRSSNFSDALESVRREMDVRLRKSKSVAEQARERGDWVFEDFETPGFPDWLASGEAFRGPSKRGIAPNQPLANDRGEGIANSFAGGSDKFVGSLTSKKFRMPKRWLHVRLAGTKSRAADRTGYADLRLTLVADAFKSRHFVPNGLGRFEWQSSRMVTQFEREGYFELVDRSREGHIVVDKIVISDSEEPPKDLAAPNRRVIEMLQRKGIHSLAALARAYRNVIEHSMNSRGFDRDSAALVGALRPTPRAEGMAVLLPEDDRASLCELQEERERLDSQIPRSAFAMSSRDENPHNVRIHLRGSHKNLGEEAPRGFLRVIDGDDQTRFIEGSGRLPLAERLTSADNALLARVMVNRIWKHHFGRGIVASMDNFGKTGERPTHPELLDFLAKRFIDSGWSIKQMHRLMLLSATYRMSNRPSRRGAAVDPENKLLHHMPTRRLEGEALRDALLALAGNLDRTLYGPSVTPHISHYQDGRGKPAESGPLDGHGRRSIYVQVRRNFLTPMFLAFDYPLPTSTIGRRNVSTVPSQALLLMNNEFVRQQAEKWARLEMSREPDTRKRIENMFIAAFGRSAREDEIREAAVFLREQRARHGIARQADHLRVWADLAHVLVNSTEFIFVR